MITQIKVYNRQSMELLARYGKASGFPYYGQTWNLISIHGDTPRFMIPENEAELKKSGLKNWLSFDFWDIIDDPMLLDQMQKQYLNYRLFDNQQAAEIVSFIKDRQNESEPSILVCHCDAGISRSGAVGVFASEFCGFGYHKAMNENSNIKPNSMVLRMLREEAGLGGKTAFMTKQEADQEQCITTEEEEYV